MMADENPAIIIPTMIKALVEFNLAEKITIKSKANKAPKNEAKLINHELFINEVNPKIDDKKITKATPKPAAEVIPKIDESANGLINYTCIITLLNGIAIPA